MRLKEQGTPGLKRMDEDDLREAADRDEAQAAALYAEFAEEDRALAEAGMADYAAGLARENTPSSGTREGRRRRTGTDGT